MADVDGSSIQEDSVQVSWLGLRDGIHRSMHSSTELGELSQWLITEL